MFTICVVSSYVSEGKSFLVNKIYGSEISATSNNSETYDICIFGPQGKKYSVNEQKKSNKISEINKKNLEEKYIYVENNFNIVDYPAFNSSKETRNIFGYFMANKSKYDMILFVIDVKRVMSKETLELINNIPEAYLICNKYKEKYNEIYEEIGHKKKYKTDDFIKYFNEKKNLFLEAKIKKNETEILNGYELRPISSLRQISGKESAEFWTDFSQMILKNKNFLNDIDEIKNKINLDYLEFLPKKFIYYLSQLVDFGDKLIPYFRLIKHNPNWDCQTFYKKVENLLEKKCEHIINSSFFEPKSYELCLLIVSEELKQNREKKIIELF